MAGKKSIGNNKTVAVETNLRAVSEIKRNNFQEKISIGEQWIHGRGKD